jgi:hypothetical protein
MSGASVSRFDMATWRVEGSEIRLPDPTQTRAADKLLEYRPRLYDPGAATTSFDPAFKRDDDLRGAVEGEITAWQLPSRVR